MISFHPLSIELYWPSRVDINPFSRTIQGDISRHQPLTISISYQAVLSIGGVGFAATSWTRLDMRLGHPFDGSSDEFANWARSERGRGRIVDEVVQVQNVLIDHLKWEFPYNHRLQNLRHFGPAEWPYIRAESDATTVLELANPSLRAAISSVPIQPTLGSFATGARVPSTVRSLLRASDLADCGYPTEALLIAFALLDSVIQQVLQNRMSQSGIEESSAEALLRNVTTSRLSTYLDPLLLLTGGHSLRVDDPPLFDLMIRTNDLRNRAIHRGLEIDRSAARHAVTIVHRVLAYLQRVTGHPRDLTVPPKFPSY